MAEEALVLVVKGQTMKRQVTDAGVSPEKGERVHPEARREEDRRESRASMWLEKLGMVT